MASVNTPPIIGATTGAMPLMAPNDRQHLCQIFARKFIRSNGTGYNNPPCPGNTLYQPESDELLNILRKQTENR